VADPVDPPPAAYRFTVKGDPRPRSALPRAILYEGRDGGEALGAWTRALLADHQLVTLEAVRGP
jgi:hypothetical protein